MSKNDEDAETLIEANAKYLRETRERLGWSQDGMASHLGLSLRGYQDMERRPMNIRPAYYLAIEMLALRRAAKRGDRALAGEYGAETARMFAELS